MTYRQVLLALFPIDSRYGSTAEKLHESHEKLMKTYIYDQIERSS